LKLVSQMKEGGLRIEDGRWVIEDGRLMAVRCRK
jgi:hypothetical protein